jgi:CBS domain-containing protein
MANSIRDVMTSDVECIKEDDTVQQAAQRLKELKVGSAPICGNDDRLQGMITDRDIAIKVVAAGKDPASVKVSELAEGKPITIAADASVDDAIASMAENQIRRLPVIEDQRLVGIVSQADLARQADVSKVGGMVESISEA